MNRENRGLSMKWNTTHNKMTRTIEPHNDLDKPQNTMPNKSKKPEKNENRDCLITYILNSKK